MHQLQEQDRNNESKRKLEDAKAQEATIKASGAARKQQLEEETAVVNIENTKFDNQLNERRQAAQEEQMAANLDNQQTQFAQNQEKIDNDLQVGLAKANKGTRNE